MYTSLIYLQSTILHWNTALKTLIYLTEFLNVFDTKNNLK